MSDEQELEQGTETDERFPSGPWVGFWMQRDYAGRQWMRPLWLRFMDGVVRGGGSDWVGRFTLRGRYDVETGRCVLTKEYDGAHTVDYEGKNEGDGLWLWGVWRIAGFDRGGFHMWPKGVADPTGAHEEAENEIPREEYEAIDVGE